MDSNEFVKEVCKYIKNAMPDEREAVAEELNAHLDDHAEALISAGRSREEAYDDAVAAMGDPVEIGNELNKEFPKVWLILSRTAAVLLVLAILVLFLPLLNTLITNTQVLIYRASPEKLMASEGAKTMDVRMDGTSGDELRFYSQHIAKNTDDNIRYESGEVYAGYVVELLTLAYDKTPFHMVAYCQSYLTFPDVAQEFYHPWRGVSSGSSDAYYSFNIINVPVEYGQESVRAVLNMYGTYAETVIPLDWEGVE